jgi:hypothetical protein
MGRGYSGNHPRFSHRQDERYDAKEAYNKDLTASARLHYLENDRHDHESPAHSHCSPMHNNRAKRLRDRAIRISERSGAERGDEYDYENPTVMDLLKKANELDERSNKKIMPKVVTQALVPKNLYNDERSGEIRNEMIDEMIDYRPDSPMNEISKRGERIINQADKGVDAYLENNTKKADRHFRRAKRIKKRDDKRHARANQSPMNACAKSEGGSGCIKQMGGAWRVISNKTDKPWPAKYASKSKAEAALRGYHAG